MGGVLAIPGETWLSGGVEVGAETLYNIETLLS